MIVCDSDVLIDALRGRQPMQDRVAGLVATGALVTTTVTAFELRSGAHSAKEVKAVEALLGAALLLPFDGSAAEAAADARRHLEGAGTTIGMADFLIAGICLAAKARLLTRNRGHFERVRGLALA